MWQAARKERAEFDEILNADSILLRFTVAGIILLCWRFVVGAWSLHGFALVLLGEALLLLFFLKLSHVLL